ncbi:murein hydrolase activator EnvC family protein [Streptomyces sp. SD15]
MRSYRRHHLLVPTLLCVFAVLVAWPSAAEDESGPGSDPGIAAQVARLYDDVSVATRQYEAGRKEADARRVEARRAEQRLARERRDIAALHADLGRMARAQYREGGGLPYVAHLLLADNADELMRGQHALWQADLAVSNAVAKNRRAEAKLAADEAKARSEWQAVERWKADLAELKRNIQAKLEMARWTLQSQADASVASGSCRGAVRLDQPVPGPLPAWVAPVETYRLSAGFGSDGELWANEHTGQDFAVPIGTPVRAVGEGRVVKVSCGGAFGIEIVIEHPGGYSTQYAHLASVTADQGEVVTTGQWIGQSGTSGNSTGPHLHFEARVSPELGSAVDPVPWLAEHGVTVR